MNDLTRANELLAELPRCKACRHAGDAHYIRRDDEAIARGRWPWWVVHCRTCKDGVCKRSTTIYPEENA